VLASDNRELHALFYINHTTSHRFYCLQVIPCICSNKRRAIAPDDLLHCFYTAAFTTSGGGPGGSASASGGSNSNVYAKFSNPVEAENNKPFYFGTWCIALCVNFSS